MSALTEKKEKLINYLKTFEKVCVAFSGGVDSALLLKMAKEALGEHVIAIMIKGAMVPESEVEDAISSAHHIGVPLIFINIDILSLDEFALNTDRRCYYCKKMLFTALIEAAHQRDYYTVVDGTNIDDLEDYRPGIKALEELHVISPFVECGFTKKDIRALSLIEKLPTYNKQALSCLATRIPKDTEINIEKLEKIEQGEKILSRYGFSQYRLRYHDHIARIEVAPGDFDLIIKEDIREEIVRELKKTGFSYICLDLAGYKMGNNN
jgi:uncharacterized protein